MSDKRTSEIRSMISSVYEKLKAANLEAGLPGTIYISSGDEEIELTEEELASKKLPKRIENIDLQFRYTIKGKAGDEEVEACLSITPESRTRKFLTDSFLVGDHQKIESIMQGVNWGKLVEKPKITHNKDSLESIMERADPEYASIVLKHKKVDAVPSIPEITDMPVKNKKYHKAVDARKLEKGLAGTALESFVVDWLKDNKGKGFSELVRDYTSTHFIAKTGQNKAETKREMLDYYEKHN